MAEDRASRVVIIDLGIGNLFSIARACEVIGLAPKISSNIGDIQLADGLILPGVGAFARAMQSLRNADLLTVLNEYRASGRPLLGICLGMQLLFEVSEEFGQHQGLGFLKGTVRSLGAKVDGKLPHIGWSPVVNHRQQGHWENTLLSQFRDKDYQYFLHSYYVDAEDEQAVLARSDYAGFGFASVIHQDNLSGCQFHPERSGSTGLAIYREWAVQQGLCMRETVQTLRELHSTTSR